MERTATRVLLIEDNPGDARLIQEMLAEAGAATLDVVWEERLSSGLARIAEREMDLVLLDLSLPDSEGLDTVAKVLEGGGGLPVVVLTGTDDEQLALRAVQMGAQDYIVKGQAPGNLLVRYVHYAIERHRMLTELGRHTRELKASESRYRDLLDTMSDWAWEVDSDGVYTMVSGRCLDILGYTPEEIVGKTPFDLMPADEARRVREIFESHIGEKKPFRDLKNWNLHKDGRQVCLLTNGVPLLDNSGGLLGYRGIDRDITERERAAERQRRQSAVIGSVNKVLHESVTRESEADAARVCLSTAEALTGSEFGFVGEVNRSGRLDVLAMSDPGWDACRIPKSNAVLMLSDIEIRGLFASVLSGEGALLSNGPVSHPDWVGLPEGHPEITSFLGVPLRQAGKTIGMLGLANKESDYTPDDQSDVEALVTAFVQALMRLRAEARTHHLNSVLRAIRNVNQLITKQGARGKLLQGACDNMTETRGWFGAWAALLDESRRVVATAESGVGEDFGAVEARLAKGELPACAEAALDGPGVVVTEDRPAVCGDCPLAQGHPGASGMATRLECGGKVYGFLSASVPREFADEEEKALFGELAGDIAFALGSLEAEETRKRAEEALRVSEADLNRAQQVARVGSWALDLTKDELVWSDETYRTFGVPKSQSPLTYTAFLDIVHPDDRAFVDKAWTAALKGDPYDIEHRIIVEGEVKWVRERAEVEFDEERQPIHGIGSVHDITGRKRAEEALAERTADLERANEELVARNVELDEFTYVASHDLQEPLRKLTAFSELLTTDLGADLPPQAGKDLAYITDAAARMQRLVDDLLALSRAGRAEMRRERVALGACVKGAIEALSARIEESAAEIAGDEFPEVFGDRTMLTQLYQNLIGNALKFRGEERPLISLTAERKDGRLVLGVRDNGIGIKPEYTEQIFAPFKRLHGVGEYEGSGIGLAICRKTVERHGGKIWVESEPGRGSHFLFTIGEAIEDMAEAA